MSLTALLVGEVRSGDSIQHEQPKGMWAFNSSLRVYSTHVSLYIVLRF